MKKLLLANKGKLAAILVGVLTVIGVTLSPEIVVEITEACAVLVESATELQE